MFEYTKLKNKISELEQQLYYTNEREKEIMKKFIELRDDKSDLIGIKESFEKMKAKENQFNSAIYENQILKELVQTLKETIINLSYQGRPQ